MVSNGGHVCCVGWPLKGKLLHDLKVKSVNNLGSPVTRSRYEMCAILAKSHVLDVSVMYPVLSCDFASLQPRQTLG